MTKPDDPARPTPMDFDNTGMTIREHFAALALQGLLLKEGAWNATDKLALACAAVEYADCLITALNAPKESPT